MKKSVALLLLMAMFVYCGCAKDPVKEDFLKYINDLKKIISLEREILTLYESETGKNHKDDASTYRMLAVAAPKYRDYVNQLEKIQPKTPEVSNLHNIYIQASNNQFDAMLLMMSALKKQDWELASKANEKISKGRASLREWTTKLEQMAKDYKIDLKK